VSIFDNDLEWHKHRKDMRDFLNYRLQFNEAEWSFMFVDSMIENFKMLGKEIPSYILEYRDSLIDGKRR
jgi:hypothetical protein